MKVVFIGDFPDQTVRKIKSNFSSAWEVVMITEDKAVQEIEDADVIIPEHIKINAEFLSHAKKLKLVQTGVGYDNVNLEDCSRFGVKVCNASGINTEAVAEHVLAFILCWYKNIVYLDHFMKLHKDEHFLQYEGAELSGKTIGIIGLGNIGRKVAEYCHAFHLNILGYSRHRKNISGIMQVNLETLYAKSDIVTIHVPLTPETEKMIDKNAFLQMKSDALLINTSRGKVVNEADLVEALQTKQIAGACLDVFEKEPLPPDSPLRDMDNVLLTPHTAGLPDGVKYHEKRVKFFAGQVEKLIRGEALDNLLN